MEEEAEKQINRISQLPDELLTKILSFVPVEDVAAGAMLVSKAWKRQSEYSFDPPVRFRFPRSPFSSTPNPEDVEMMPSFIKAVDSSLKLLLLPKKKYLRRRLAGLRMDLDLVYFVESRRGLIDSWIDAAIERKVVLLRLCFQPFFGPNPYHLSAKVFCGCRTITVLRLQECRFEISGDMDIDLPVLRKLYLIRIVREEAAIEKLISSCPLIEDLQIIWCRLQEIHISGAIYGNLRRLFVEDCYGLERMEIMNAPNLEYLEYMPTGGSITIGSDGFQFQILREFLLSISHVPEDFIQTMDFTLPNLERLGISCEQWERIEISRHQLMRLERLKIYCGRWERIKISHRRLKRLNLDLTRTLASRRSRSSYANAVLKIHTPNLESLEYYGYRRPFISLTSSLNTSSLQKLHIKFVTPKDYTHYFIFRLKYFFEKMKHCQHLKVHLEGSYNKTEFIIPKKLRPHFSPPIYHIKHLSLYVSICHHRGSYAYLVDRILWMCHPQTLSFSPRTNCRFLKVLYDKFRNKEEHPRCCSSCRIKCWRHYLEEVQIDADKSKFQIDKIMMMPPHSSDLDMMQSEYQVMFTLKWRSSTFK